MKKALGMIFAGMMIVFFVMVLFVNILPGMMVEGFARAVPGAKPDIAAWIVAGLPEAYEFEDSDVDWLSDQSGDSYEYYNSGTVYAGGVVEFWNYVNLNPSFSCTMSSTNLTDCYGTARGVNWNDHGGIDFGINDNANVVAPLGGVVTYAGPKGSYGNLVVIESNGYQTYFAHNKSISVKVGQTIEAGEKISNAGSTGNSTGTHIHFEVRRCDPETGYCTPVNPNSVILPGATEECDFYFGKTVHVNWGGSEEIAFSCGVNDAGKYFIHYECNSSVQRSNPWCQ